MKQYFKGYSLYLLIFIVLLLFIIFANGSGLNRLEPEFTNNQFYSAMDSGSVKRIEIYPKQPFPTGIANVYFESENVVKHLNIYDVQEFRNEIEKQYPDIILVTKDVEKENIFWQFLPTIIIMVVLLFVFMFIMQQVQGGGGGGSRVMSFGKSKAKMVVDDKRKITFQNVAGLDEEKEELREVVDFLKQSRKFVELGARIPKGVLLVGPPGTGKTLLAKAVAGEAAVPFFSISGSDFVEMFVGVGASRVRDLFDQAKKNAPCIVFIDEIDAVGRKRGAGLGGGHDEREQTLNQLLVEMDGFGINEGVIVIAATNRVDILDPALLRPGRFDRKVMVGRPDVKGREEILQVHAKGKPMDENVDLKVIARTTSGFTGADLENLLNEAAIYAARNNKTTISMNEIQRAFVKVAIGTEKKSRVISEKEKKDTAYHEAGHAIIQHVLPQLDEVHSISIIPTGMAGGYTMHLPKEDNMFMTKKKMEQELIALLGGRAAEELIIKDVTTGASNDIERATKISRAMVTKYGMSDVLGPMQFGDDNDEVFIGRDWNHTRNYGENIASIIDNEIKRLIDEAYQHSLDILQENMDILHKTAALLIKKEKITGKEFVELFGEELEDDVKAEIEKEQQEDKEK